MVKLQNKISIFNNKNITALYKYTTSFHTSNCLIKSKRQIFFKEKKQPTVLSSEQISVSLCKNKFNITNKLENYEKVELDNNETNIKYSMLKTLKTEEHFLIVQPIPGKNDIEYTDTKLDLLMLESVGLVNSVPGFFVTESLTANIRPSNKELFTRLDILKIIQTVKQHPKTSAIFISVERITKQQKLIIYEATGIEKIFDRYLLVLEIFKLRAKTKQAKLQVALAEIPYLRQTIKFEDQQKNRGGGGFSGVGGSGETLKEIAIRRFKQKEKKLRTELEKLKNIRDSQRVARKNSLTPIVGVVGYTNAGKTSLIKVLTGSERLNPQNYLFATLDVTSHAAISTNNVRYVLVDTVGFLSNLPHGLFDAFNATMEDMLQADIIIHVCDVSHPDRAYQRNNVIKVLSELKLPQTLLNNIIEVHNKIDRISPEERLKIAQPEILQISTKTGDGLQELDSTIERSLIQVTEGAKAIYRVPAAGPHLDWLERHASVMYAKGYGDYQLDVHMTITKPMADKFKANFNNFDIINSTPQG